MTQCVAEERNKKELELIRKQQIEARATLEQLDLKHKASTGHSLIHWIESASALRRIILWWMLFMG